jgi:hypothetical protein
MVLTMVLSGVFFLLSQEARAGGSQMATVVQVEGRAQLFTQPSKRLQAPSDADKGTIGLFEGNYYRINDLKTGARVENGNLLRTLPGAKAKVIYDNGDQIYVGPGSSYRISWNEQGKGVPEIELKYGRMRGVISKEGPRRKIIIRTRSAVMGVRGTDFFIDEGGGLEETSVRVLRGAVEVAPLKGKPQVVETGMTAEVGPKVETVEVRKISREDLGEIRVASTLKGVKEEVSAELKSLEKKAVEVTLKDIEIYQPEVLKSISKDSGSILDPVEINAKVVDVAAVTAPSVPKKRRPGLQELMGPDGVDYYEKYFKSRD